MCNNMYQRTNRKMVCYKEASLGRDQPDGSSVCLSAPAAPPTPSDHKTNPPAAKKIFIRSPGFVSSQSIDSDHCWEEGSPDSSVQFEQEGGEGGGGGGERTSSPKKRGAGLLGDRSLFLCRLCSSSLAHFQRAKHLMEKHQISLAAYLQEFGKTEILRFVFLA